MEIRFSGKDMTAVGKKRFFQTLLSNAIGEFATQAAQEEYGTDREYAILLGVGEVPSATSMAQGPVDVQEGDSLSED